LSQVVERIKELEKPHVFSLTLRGCAHNTARLSMYYLSKFEEVSS
jgi:hypothetical protein